MSRPVIFAHAQPGVKIPCAMLPHAQEERLLRGDSQGRLRGKFAWISGLTNRTTHRPRRKKGCRQQRVYPVNLPTGEGTPSKYLRGNCSECTSANFLPTSQPFPPKAVETPRMSFSLKMKVTYNAAVGQCAIVTLSYASRGSCNRFFTAAHGRRGLRSLLTGGRVEIREYVLTCRFSVASPETTG